MNSLMYLGIGWVLATLGNAVLTVLMGSGLPSGKTFLFVDAGAAIIILGWWIDTDE